jgi:transcriptional regulator with XRE-family HTH domain
MTILPVLNPISAEAIARLRDLRKQQQVTAAELAQRVTELGFPIGRAVIANGESGRKQVLELDYAVLAARALGTGLWPLLAEVVACPQCKGEPPIGFTCNRCGGIS